MLEYATSNYKKVTTYSKTTDFANKYNRCLMVNITIL